MHHPPTHRGRAGRHRLPPLRIVCSVGHSWEPLSSQERNHPIECQLCGTRRVIFLCPFSSWWVSLSPHSWAGQSSLPPAQSPKQNNLSPSLAQPPSTLSYLPSLSSHLGCGASSMAFQLSLWTHQSLLMVLGGVLCNDVDHVPSLHESFPCLLIPMINLKPSLWTPGPEPPAPAHHACLLVFLPCSLWALHLTPRPTFIMLQLPLGSSWAHQVRTLSDAAVHLAFSWAALSLTFHELTRQKVLCFLSSPGSPEL